MTRKARAQTAFLLGTVFPGTRLNSTDYLCWLYDESPFGTVIETNLDDEHGRAAHYAVTPITLSVDGSDRAGALSLNTAVHARARGQGVFVRLANETYAEARRRGIDTILGVGNANSTHGLVRRLGFDFVAQLPVTVMAPVPGRRGQHFVTAWAGASAQELFEDAVDILAPPDRGIARIWDVKTLTWRLRSPGSRYAVHRNDDALAVTTVERRNGLRVAVILKVFARRMLGPASVQALVRSSARWHHAPLVLHAGINDRMAPRGISLPARLRPSPLNFVRRELTPPQGQAPIVRFELLDFDAY